MYSSILCNFHIRLCLGYLLISIHIDLPLYFFFFARPHAVIMKPFSIIVNIFLFSPLLEKR